MKFDGVMASFAFCELENFCKICFIALGRPISKVAQYWQILIILIIFTKKFILGNFGKMPLGQILTDLSKISKINVIKSI